MDTIYSGKFYFIFLFIILYFLRNLKNAKENKKSKEDLGSLPENNIKKIPEIKRSNLSSKVFKKNTKEISKDKIDSEKKKKYLSTLMKNSSLKDAVILSEVLKRPYK